MPSTDDDSDEFIDMLPLESDEEKVKEGKGLKVLTSNKLLTRLSILLAQVKAGNNSHKSKNEIRQILYFFISMIQSPETFTTLWWSHHINGRKYDCDKRSQTFCFNFDFPEDFDGKLKHEIKFIIESNKYLAEIIIKNEIEQSLLKHKHGSNIHEHRKQQNEWTT